MPKHDTERLMRLTDRANRLRQLTEQPAWEELRRLVEERKQFHYNSMMKQLIAGAAVDQRYVDRMAGYFKGMEDLLASPGAAESKRQSALRKAELFAEGEEAA